MGGERQRAANLRRDVANQGDSYQYGVNPVRGNMACLAGIHHWSDWEVRDPQRPSEQVRTCARCLHAQRSGDRARGKVACRVGVHDWSDWVVPDLQRPGEQVRTCARCPRTKNNAAVVPLRSLFWLGAWIVRYALTVRRRSSWRCRPATPGRFFGRQATLNAGAHCAPMSTVSAGQH